MILTDNKWVLTKEKSFISLHGSFDWKCTSDKKPILFIGGVHGDEPEGVSLAESLLEWLKNNNSKNLKTHWILIPCLNPDGFKNNQRVNSNGVDLNRNYPSVDWTPKHDAPRYYPGPTPSSEIEITNLCQLIHKVKPQLIVHFHSWKPCLVFAGPNDAHPLVDELAQSSNYEVISDIGYPTPGSLSQWAWKDHKIPVLCIEEREGANKEEIWTRFGPGFTKFLSP